MDKIEYLNKYINELSMIDPLDTFSCERLIEEICRGVLLAEEVPTLYLDYFNGNNVHDYSMDISIVKSKLGNNLAEYISLEKTQERELEKLKLQAEIAKASNNINVTATGGNSSSHATSNATSTVTITIEQTIKTIADIPNEVLSPDEKEKLQDDLYTLEGIRATKNKARFWDKAKAVLAFLADKGADALIAAAPYIITALQTM